MLNALILVYTTPKWSKDVTIIELTLESNNSPPVTHF